MRTRRNLRYFACKSAHHSINPSTSTLQLKWRKDMSRNIYNRSTTHFSGVSTRTYCNAQEAQEYCAYATIHTRLLVVAVECSQSYGVLPRRVTWFIVFEVQRGLRTRASIRKCRSSPWTSSVDTCNEMQSAIWDRYRLLTAVLNIDVLVPPGRLLFDILVEFRRVD